jgi:ADP-heptose:LPS heptosyltransferase
VIEAMSVRQDWSRCGHVLAIRLDGPGDVLMTTPALRALRAAGARRITLLGSPAGAALLPFVPEIDDAQACEVAWMKNEAGGNQADLDLIGRLRALRPDAAVIFTACTQSALPAALLCHLAGIPRILGHSRENPHRLLTHWVRDDVQPPDGMRHEVRRQLDLVAAVGAQTADWRLSFRVREADHEGLNAILRGVGVAEESGWIAVHAASPSRRHSPRLLTQALMSLEPDDRRILVLGGAEDEAQHPELQEARERLPGLVNLSGMLSLGELAAALERACVLMCNNTVPAHIAAALGMPVVAAPALGGGAAGLRRPGPGRRRTARPHRRRRSTLMLPSASMYARRTSDSSSTPLSRNSFISSSSVMYSRRRLRRATAPSRTRQTRSAESRRPTAGTK